jgi:hypothetical protein
LFTPCRHFLCPSRVLRATIMPSYLESPRAILRSRPGLLASHVFPFAHATSHLPTGCYFSLPCKPAFPVTLPT